LNAVTFMTSHSSNHIFTISTRALSNTLCASTDELLSSSIRENG
jgi:hypothetical protein